MKDCLDSAVIDRLCAGDLNGAVSMTLEARGPRLRGFIRSVLLDSVAAEEVYAELCWNVYRGLPTFRGEGRLDVWLYRLARHACWRYFQKRKRERLVRVGLPAAPSSTRWTFAEPLVAAGPRSPTSTWRGTPARDAYRELREALSPEERSLLILRVDKRLSWPEVAEAMSGERGPERRRLEATLRKRFERIVRKLGRLAKRQGLLS